LNLEDIETEILNDDVVEGTESRSGEGSEDLDTHVAVGLGIEESLLELVGTELLVLETGLVRADTLNHELLVFFRPALGAHRAIRKCKNDIESPEERDTAVTDEDGLPCPNRRMSGVRLEARMSDCREGVCEKTTDDLLGTV
jgi:hypothetical protein